MKIGLVLSGGLAKGAYQVGFLKALSEYIRIDEIKVASASSVGIVNAYGLLTGKIDTMLDVWKSLHFEGVSDVIRSVWKEKFIEKKFDIIFSESDYLSVPLFVSICYLPLLHINYFKMSGLYHKKMRKLVRKAIGFPVISGPIRFSRFQVAVDGGIMDNIPAYPIIEEDLDMILVLHFHPKYRPKREWQKNRLIIDLDISAENKFRKESFNFDGYVLNNMIDAGYDYGQKICSKLFAGGSDLDRIRSESILIHKAEYERRILSQSLDSWVSKVNSFTQIFRIGCMCKKTLRCRRNGK